MVIKTLSEKLSVCRADRPDEWTMDEFKLDAIKLEAERNEALEKLAAMESQTPVAWMHNSREIDVISTAIKDLVHKSFTAHGFYSQVERAPVDKSENYTIPLYCTPAPADKPAALTLDSPARVNHTVFGKGVFHSTVVDAAKRYYQHMQEPQPDAETIANAQEEMRQLMGKPKADKPAVAVPNNFQDAIVVLKENLRDKDRGVKKCGIRDNDQVRDALSTLLSDTSRSQKSSTTSIPQISAQFAIAILQGAQCTYGEGHHSRNLQPAIDLLLQSYPGHESEGE